MKPLVKLEDHSELFTTKERPGAEDCWDCSKRKEHPSANPREIRFMGPVSSTCGTSQAFLKVNTRETIRYFNLFFSSRS